MAVKQTGVCEDESYKRRKESYPAGYWKEKVWA